MFANVFNELRSNVRDFSELALINNTNYFAANIEARAGFTLPKRPDAERFMSAADFRAALALLHERGVSANELHRINNQPRRWARIGAPRYVALALAAVLKNIPPWTPPRRR
jgi:hypothetical protein